jgi:uncharacterized protein YcbK (DUF882 family)
VHLEQPFARRRLLQLGLIAAGAAAFPAIASAQGLEPPPEIRRVALHNLHTGEQLDAVYWEKGDYVPDALEAADKVLRDFRTGDVHAIDRGLFDLLDDLSTKVDSRKPFEIISGYRSPKTNAMLHERSEHSGVANNSYHMKGMAMDVRLADVDLRHLHNAALSMGRGGVGYYPASDFVHVDVGPVRRW